ncbi:MAG: intein-containing RctB family protein [Anaerolineae bacterium]
MVSKENLRQVGEYVWEIPQDYRWDMRAPARIYADAALLEDALKDESVEQLVNTATLPGIVKYAIAMPDIHQGYGFPIGGVVATELPDGVISPGGVGFDINCLDGSTRILHQFGYTQTISEMESTWQQDNISCQDMTHERPSRTAILNYLKQKPRTRVFRLKTEGGDEIIATGDHPFWTPQGMVPAREFQRGETIALYPFEGVPYEKPPTDVILTEEQLRASFDLWGKNERGNASTQILNYLRRCRLLPLRYDSPQLPHLLKLLGYVIGDGTVYFESESGKGVTGFYGTREDLESICEDILACGFTPSGVYERHRESSITTDYGEKDIKGSEYSVRVAGSGFALLLFALGAPVGNKAKQSYELPGWIKGAPRWQKRLFLAALFGAELTAPKAFDDRNANFYTPILSMNKRAEHVASGRAFLAGLEQLLEEFGVEVNTISERIECVNAKKELSHRLRLIISSKPESLISLWSRVGFEYNHKRQQLANIAVQYLKHKQRITTARIAVSEKAQAMQEAGISPSAIFDALVSTHVNKRFIERSLYEGRSTAPRIHQDFPKLDEYAAYATESLHGTGMVWERIVEIEPVAHDDFVYDFTVQHPDHNFVANGFVVSNCGVRVLASHVTAQEIAPYVDDLATALYRNCPSGVGSTGSVKLESGELDKVLNEGAQWALARGYAEREDLKRTEEFGRLDRADASAVSHRAKERGQDQLGTLGAGNHFIEVDRVAAVYDEAVASRLGLYADQVVAQIHCGSRGLGHQVCQDYVDRFQSVVHRYGIVLPDRELAAAPYSSPEGQQYAQAMAAAANFAFANRQVLAYHIRRSFQEALAHKVRDFHLHPIYDIAHNMAKVEDHVVNDRSTPVLVHRKGATRAFGPGAKVLPDDLREIGQPVLIPGSMGTMSFILVGTSGSMAQTFGSSCHGAGRVMSRSRAKKTIRGDKLRAELSERGIIIRAGSMSGLAEEAPEAYKDVSRVVDVVDHAGIGKKVARLEPITVIKG